MIFNGMGIIIMLRYFMIFLNPEKVLRNYVESVLIKRYNMCQEDTGNEKIIKLYNK